MVSYYILLAYSIQYHLQLVHSDYIDSCLTIPRMDELCFLRYYKSGNFGHSGMILKDLFLGFKINYFSSKLYLDLGQSHFFKIGKCLASADYDNRALNYEMILPSASFRNEDPISLSQQEALHPQQVCILLVYCRLQRSYLVCCLSLKVITFGGTTWVLVQLGECCLDNCLGKLITIPTVLSIMNVSISFSKNSAHDRHSRNLC